MRLSSMSVYLIRYSEIGLKGPRARKSMENTLIANIKAVLVSHGNLSIENTRGRLFLETDAPEDFVKESLTSVFGIKSFSRVHKYSFETKEELIDIILDHFRDLVDGKTFAVRCRRSGSHAFTSLDIEKLAGELLFPYSSGVNLKKPEVTVNIEVREDSAFLFSEIVSGPGGLPLPSQGTMIGLMSGGIDSPVATWFMMKRGALVHPMFFSLAHPVDTVSFLDSAEKLFGRWLSGRSVEVFIVDGRKLIEYTVSGKGMKYPNIGFKRVLYRTAEKIAAARGFQGIITGESLGQVSSQTASNLEALSYETTLPVYRPLIGFDKDEITDMARKIGTFPESDTGEFCSLFSEHPAVGIPRDKLLEEKVPEDLVNEMIENTVTVNSSKLHEYRLSLIKADLKAYSVDETALIIDMRKKEEYNRSHYPGSVNVHLSDLAVFTETIDISRPVLLYCKKGLQSAYAASMLRDRGFSAFYTDERIIGKKEKN